MKIIIQFLQNNISIHNEVKITINMLMFLEN